MKFFHAWKTSLLWLLKGDMLYCNSQVYFLPYPSWMENLKFYIIVSKIFKYVISLQVEFLLTKLCDTSSIGELDLKVSTMKLNFDLFISTILFNFYLIRYILNLAYYCCFLSWLSSAQLPNDISLLGFTCM